MFSSCWPSSSERQRALTLLLAAATVAGCAHLPGMPSLEPGQRVRVQAREAEPPRVTGTVIALTADSLALAVGPVPTGGGDGPRVAFPIAAIERVEVSSGVHAQTLNGMVYGSQVGLIVILLGTLAGEWIAGDEESIGVFVGCTLTGGAIGALVREEDWRRMPLSCVRVSLRALPGGGGGVGVGIVLRR